MQFRRANELVKKFRVSDRLSRFNQWVYNLCYFYSRREKIFISNKFNVDGWMSVCVRACARACVPASLRACLCVCGIGSCYGWTDFNSFFYSIFYIESIGKDCKDACKTTKLFHCYLNRRKKMIGLFVTSIHVIVINFMK